MGKPITAAEASSDKKKSKNLHYFMHSPVFYLVIGVLSRIQERAAVQVHYKSDIFLTLRLSCNVSFKIPNIPQIA